MFVLQVTFEITGCHWAEYVPAILFGKVYPARVEELMVKLFACYTWLSKYTT